ncbi:unnamed protein product, partial [Rotaria magnacalcarata]
YGVNLLMNGDGETGSCTQSNNITHPTLWSYVGNISQVAYNASGTNPSLSSTSSGPSHAITMSQSIDLFPYITVIASGNVSFNLSVWLSGYENQNDSAQVSVYFLNYAYQSVGNQTTTGLAVAADHNFITSLVFCQIFGMIPVDTHDMTIIVTVIRTFGASNDGCLDNIIVELRRS